MEKVIDIINSRGDRPVFSFEVLPPLKGNSIYKVFGIIDRLREFDPQFVNITSHHSEIIYREQPDGSIRREGVRRRPGTVAIAAAIRHKYGIIPVPHLICRGFTREETEYALLDLNFLGITNLLLLRGDDKGNMKQAYDPALCNAHTTDLQEQINRFNVGIGLDGTVIEGIETPFTYGVACYPEKHEEAPNMESDIRHLKMKVDAGAHYAITQLFYDNSRYFEFVDRCREAGINVPILPGIKPITKKSQLAVLPRVFRADIPEPLARELEAARDDSECVEIGIRWGIEQCRELIAGGAPGIHFYTMLASHSVGEIAKQVF